MKIMYPTDCGNAPKKVLIIDLFRALADKKHTKIIKNLDEDLTLTVAGLDDIYHLDDVGTLLDQVQKYEFEMLSVEDVITHGHSASVYGHFKHRYYKLDFAMVVTFKGFSKFAKIKYVKLFLVKSEM